jgi:hypothetical protein
VQIIEARKEADTILTALEKARRSEAWQAISEDARDEIGRLEGELNQIKTSEDYKAIRSAVQRLDQASRRLAELMMDSAVSSALKGKDMQQADMGEGPKAPHPFAPAEFK